MNKKYKPYFDRTSKSLPMKAVFEEFLKDSRFTQKFNHERIKYSWEEIMGEPIARRTSKLFIKDAKLFVEIISGPLKNELILSKTKVLARVQDFPGGSSIKDIVFL